MPASSRGTVLYLQFHERYIKLFITHGYIVVFEVMNSQTLSNSIFHENKKKINMQFIIF